MCVSVSVERCVIVGGVLFMEDVLLLGFYCWRMCYWLGVIVRGCVIVRVCVNVVAGGCGSAAAGGKSVNTL